MRLRDLDSAYEQYRAFKVTREAAAINVRVQNDLFKPGLKGQTYLNVLQALNDWGNSVTLEAQALISCNVALATLDVVAHPPEDCPLCKQGIPVEKPGSRPAA